MKKITQIRESRILRSQALDQLRKTSAHLEQELPGLLEELRTAVYAELGRTHGQEHSLPIDRRKNKETVMRVLALKPSLLEALEKSGYSGKEL